MDGWKTKSDRQQKGAGGKDVYNHQKTHWIGAGEGEGLFLIVKVPNLGNWMNDATNEWDIECQKKMGSIKKQKQKNDPELFWIWWVWCTYVNRWATETMVWSLGQTRGLETDLRLALHMEWYSLGKTHRTRGKEGEDRTEKEKRQHLRSCRRGSSERDVQRATKKNQQRAVSQRPQERVLNKPKW